MLSMPLLVRNYPMFVSLPIRGGRHVVPEILYYMHQLMRALLTNLFINI